jgi:hypothetical protein
MRFIDPSTNVSSWVDTSSQGLRIFGAQTTTVAGGYTIYTFTTEGVNPIIIQGRGPADILFVGGGGGAAGLGGGGGAGGYIFRYNVLIQGQGSVTSPNPSTNHIQVGRGGHGPTNNSHGPIAGAGSPSKLVIDGATAIEAVGGGSGGNWNSVASDFKQDGSHYPSYFNGTIGNNLHLGQHTPLSLNPASPFPSQYGPGHAGGRGGSGGGGAGNGPGTWGSAVLGQGHPGGHGHHPNHYKGGGGGGAGEKGMDTNPGWPGGLQHHNGQGGDGLANDINGVMTHYAGGGGGGGHHPTVHTGGGGMGGGTTGGTHSPDHGNRAPATGALPGTGGGAGAGNNPEAQGRGGPGIVIIRVNNNYTSPGGNMPMGSGI